MNLATRHNFLKEFITSPPVIGQASDLIGKRQLMAARGLSDLKAPTVRDEGWRFTDLSPIYDTDFTSPTKETLDYSVIKKFFLPEAKNRLVFINGVYSKEFSDVSVSHVGVFVGNLDHYPDKVEKIIKMRFAEGDDSHSLFFPALNTKMVNDLALVVVDSNAKVENPIHLLHISTGKRHFSNFRVLVALGRGSSASIFEDFISINAEQNLTNTVVEVGLEESASLDHLKIQREDPSCFNISYTNVQQERNSQYSYCSISTGSHVDRQDIVVSQIGIDAECSLDGLTFLSGNQTGGFHSKIIHDFGGGISKQLHKTVVAGKARSDFNGQIHVRPDGHLSNASQSNKNLLLSSKGRINTKPQLEIFADDVKCSHGATVGQLSDEEIFYLQSRGIALDDARKILIYGFASEIISLIGIESVATLIREQVLQQTGNKYFL